jgi:hypothetical protein
MANKPSGYVVQRYYYSEDLDTWCTEDYPELFDTKEAAAVCMQNLKEGSFKVFGGFFDPENDSLSVVPYW